MDFTTLTALIANYSIQGQPAAEFTAALPLFVANAESTIYRQLVPSAASGQNTSLSTAIGQRVLDLSTMTGQTVDGQPVAFQYPVIVEAIAVLVSDALNGQPGWIQFMPTSLEYIDSIWPSPTVNGTPGFPFAYFNMLDNRTIVMAPTPDDVYPLRVTGVWRPAAQSAAIPTTWLSETFPDLLFKGCMVEAFGWMRDFGAMTDDPRAAVSWRTQFEAAMESALQEEALRQGQGSIWRAQQASAPHLGGLAAQPAMTAPPGAPPGA